MLTNIEMAVLGLIAETPKHGYQVEQDIEARGMREWTDIGFSSIYYVLGKLEKAGWLESSLSSEPAPAGPARKVYRLTAQGQSELRGAVLERLSCPRPRSGDFELALANLPALPPETAWQALARQRERLDAQMAQVRAKWDADREGARAPGRPLPPHVDALFDWSLAMMAAQRNWVAQYLSDGGWDEHAGLEEGS